MLLPDTPWGKKGEPVTFIYQWGHPFEHQLFDALPPETALIVGPDAKQHHVSKDFEKTKIKGGEGQDVTAYKLRFTPAERGDYTVIVQTPPIWMEEEKEFYQDTVRVVLHVQAQKNWDTDLGPAFRMVPLTRPYGLYSGMVFRARVLDRGLQTEPKPAPWRNVNVFVERYNAKPPKELPDDELITFTSKTDANGILTCSFPTAGWWSVTAQVDGGRRDHNGRAYPVRKRATTWVFVHEKK